jgi:hypothetical protein
MRGISWLAAKTGQLLKKDFAPWSNNFFSVKLFSNHILKSSLMFQGRYINLDHLTELLTTQKLKADRVSSLCVINCVSESENRTA